MLRRTGFKRRVYEPAPSAPPRPAVRAATYSGSTNGVAPKPQAHRNAHLLTLARDQQCLLQVPDVCSRDPATTVACHSNLAEHGKAKARKADDHYVVFGCGSCHAWLDQGPAPYEAKRDLFLAALPRQLELWMAITADQARPQRDRAAAHWAIQHLKATG